MASFGKYSSLLSCCSSSIVNKTGFEILEVLSPWAEKIRGDLLVRGILLNLEVLCVSRHISIPNLESWQVRFRELGFS